MIFPVSLSEIAFVLVLILMLLLGYMLLRELLEKRALQEKLAYVHETQVAQAATQAFQIAQQKFEQALASAGHPAPQDITQRLIADAKAAAERDELQRQIQDLTERLAALQGLQSAIEKAGKAEADKTTRQEVIEALKIKSMLVRLVEGQDPQASGEANSKHDQQSKPIDQNVALQRIRDAMGATIELREQARKKLNLEIKAGTETQAVRDVVEAARLGAAAAQNKTSAGAMAVELARAQAQLGYYEKRDKLRGLDHPPCWMDKDSRIEYIFNVQTTSNGYVVTPGWASHREADAHASQGFDLLMTNSGSPLSAQQFSLGAKPFLDFGKRQSPECRHFVYLSSVIPDADRRDEARRLVNSYFYILERKAPVVP